jgi:hypothetical protein
MITIGCNCAGGDSPANLSRPGLGLGQWCKTSLPQSCDNRLKVVVVDVVVDVAVDVAVAVAG